MDFVDVMNALKLMCDETDCANCSLHELSVKYSESCFRLLKEYPEEVGQLVMGVTRKTSDVSSS